MAEVSTLTFPVHQADPPSEGGTDTSAGGAAAIGGDGGFSLQRSTWDVIAGQGDALSDMRDFLETTKENPALNEALPTL